MYNTSVISRSHYIHQRKANLEPMLGMIDPLTFPGWDELLLSQDTRSFFHTSNWARVLHETYNYKPLYIASIEQDKLLALMPLMEIKSLIAGKRGVSLPFSDYCEIVASGETEFNSMMNYLIKYGEKSHWKSIEMMDGRFFKPDTLNCSLYCEYSLDTTKNPEYIFRTFKENTRRNIKKAMKMGVTVHRYNSLESIKEYYRLHCLTRKRHGLPPQPYIFFKNIYKYIISNNHGFVMLASFNNIFVAGAIYFNCGNQVLFKYGASDLRYKRLRANHLVMWKAIEWFSRNGYEKLSLGRTDPNNEGLKRFKKGWGATEQIIRYYKYDFYKHSFTTNIQSRMPFCSKILKRMPILVLKCIGSIFYRHMG